MSQVGKPWPYKDHIYFEGHDTDKPTPMGWNIYRSLRDGAMIEKLCEGANPAIYNSVLYTTLWVMQQFAVVRRALMAAAIYVPQCLCA